jgi:predicted Holliday junction resolvase-like endonuclease
MNAMKRNQRRAEHNREVQRLIDEKRAMREAERQREMEDIATEREREDRRRAIIEQERQRLLEEHATKLAAYLPKGVLQEDDIARLGLDPATTGTATSLPKF